MNEYDGFWAGTEVLVRGLALPIILGTTAAIVRIARLGWKNWRHLLTSSVVSIFTAVVTFWCLDYLDLQPTVDAAIIGLSSYFGGNILDSLMFRVNTEIRKGDLFRRRGEKNHIEEQRGFYNEEFNPGRRESDRRD